MTARDLAFPVRVTIREKLYFAVVTAHSGWLNLALHAVSVPLLVQGLVERRPLLLLAGLALDVAGHAWDYIVHYDAERRERFRQAYPVALALAAVIFLPAMALLGWF